MNPKVTVFTPSYNQPKYVGQAIQSVLAQTFRNFDYIISENSTDKITKKVVKSFKDTRIRYFDDEFSQEERKKFYVPAYLINKYYPKSQGEYIIFLAHDDLLFPNCLEVMVNFLESHPKIDVCFHDQAIFYALGSRTWLESLVRGTTQVLKKPLGPNPKNALDGGQIMFRSRLIEKLTQPFLPLEWEAANICDKIFMEKLWQLAEFYPVKRVLSLHRIVEGSTHRRRNPLKYWLYMWGTELIPKGIQLQIARKLGKRRIMSRDERIAIEEFLTSTQVR